MKRSDYSGFMQVFKYTLSQSLKAKSFVVTMIIMGLIIAASFPVINYMNRDKGEIEETKIEKVLVNDSTGLLADASEAVKDEEAFKKVEFVRETRTLKEMEEAIKDKHENIVYLVADLTEESGGYELKMYRDDLSDVDYEEVEALSKILRKYAEKQKIATAGVSAEVLEMLNKDVNSTTMGKAEYLEEDVHDIISFNDYNVVYAFLMIAYMVICISAGMVSTKVVEEKANRVVEYLMTNVRPMALILGKVCATAVLACSEIAYFAIVGGISNKVSAAAFNTTSSETLSRYISMDAIKSLSPINIFICIVLIALGIVVFGLLAGLSAASVSKMEDLGQASKVYMIVLLVGFFVGLTAVEMMWTVGIGPFVKFTFMCPVTSIFVLPGAILIGKASIVDIVVAIVLEVIFAYIVLRFVALVYESVVVMNGGVVKTKQIIAIAKQNRKYAKSRKEGVKHE